MAREHEIPYYVNGTFQRLAIRAFGDTHAPPVVCVHGLSRNAHDFDVLAEALADEFYVICPDMPGRGRSSWLPDPALYQIMTYVGALSHLLAFIDREVAWIGTSMGGICGMVVVAAAGHPVRRLVLNDIGPFVPQAAFARIVDYVGAMPRFAGIAEADAYLRRVHGSFGALSDAQWRRMAETSTRRDAAGGLVLHYDPALAEPLRAAPPRDTEMWHFWEKIACPMLVLRGESSDILLPETYQRMLGRARGHVVAGAGHAPALMDAPTIAVLRDFLRE